MKRVLIVDDEADVLWMLQKNLNKGMTDVEVLVAASGEEALSVLHAHPIDLVITDINMPGMNGLDLLVEINNEYPHTGVIIITAYPSNTYQSQAILAGSLKFIEKPFDIKYLRKIVEEFFNHKKNGFQGTISGIDLIDIVQFNGLSRATAALRVTTGESTGMIFFKDGQVVHAICDQTSGEEAFFTILGFHGGNLKNIKGVETPQVTIAKSMELLLLEAASSGDEVMEKEDEPFFSNDDLDKEPPPAFLSQQVETEPQSVRDEESPAFLSDDVWEKDMEQGNSAAKAIPGMVLDTEEPAVISTPDTDEQSKRASFAKTSSLLSAELRNQRAAAFSDKTPTAPARNRDEEESGALLPDGLPDFLAETAEDGFPAMEMPAANDDDFPRNSMGDSPGFNTGGKISDKPPLASSLTDAPASPPNAVLTKPPAKSPAQKAEVPAPTLAPNAEAKPTPNAPKPALESNPAARQAAASGLAKGGKTTKARSPFDSILAEFTAIDGVHLACLAGRDGFLVTNQPKSDSAQAERLSAIASSTLASAESMGEELSHGSLQTTLFEYQDGIIILSPLGQNSILMVVAEESINLGWLRLVIRKNTARLEEISAE